MCVCVCFLLSPPVFLDPFSFLLKVGLTFIEFCQHGCAGEEWAGTEENIVVMPANTSFLPHISKSHATGIIYLRRQ